MARFNEQDLQKLVSRPNYGIAGGISGGIAGTVRAGAALTKVGGSGPLDDMEPDSSDESLGSKKLQIGYSGRPEIRITFYRHRLADHARAISEKALVDCLQYAGLIEGDSEKEIRLTDVKQEKIGTDEEERTEIEIFYEGVNYNEPWHKAAQHHGR